MIDQVYLLVIVGMLSISCQYLAYRLKIPAILPLLLVGIIAGPVFGFINADQLFGDLLFPVVSLSVAIILFEGALTLNLKELSGHGAMVRNLCTIGALVTWLTVSVAAMYTVQLDWQVAFLFGAVVTVTGPTVIMPMLRTIRPSTGVANILRWEGIVIDPVGALLAVLVFEYIMAIQDAIAHTFYAFGSSLLSGFGIGAIVGFGLGFILKKHWLPQYLVNTAVLTIVLAAFAFANFLSHESGLLTVTVIGMVLANMKDVDLDSIIEFKETLSVLLISALFILLASRINLLDITQLGLPVVVLVIAVMFVARPLAVWLSSIGTKLRWQELFLLSWISPRGIVAAAVSALFAIQLEVNGFAQANLLVPLVFLIIVVTVVFQSLTATFVAKWLGERCPPSNGVLIFGGNDFARKLAKGLQDQDIFVTIADTNWAAISSARMEGIPTYFGNPMSNHAEMTLDLDQFGKVLVVSPYKQINTMLIYHFQSYFGKEAVYALPLQEKQSRASHKVSEEYARRLSLFGQNITYGYLASMVAKGGEIKATRLSDTFDDAAYQQTYGDRAVRLFAINKEGKLRLYTTNYDFKPGSDWYIISLVSPSST